MTDLLFDRFWEAYPRKQAKKDARRAFLAARVDDHLLHQMLSALVWQKDQPQWSREGTFIPLPATWIRGERWQDEPFQPCHPVPVSPREATEALEAYREYGCRHFPRCTEMDECLTKLVQEHRGRQGAA